MEKTYYFATTNDKKFKEIEQILKELRPDLYLVQIKFNIKEIQGTAKEISEDKTRQVLKFFNNNVFTETISLSCKGLHGIPGPYIKLTSLPNLNNLVELSGNSEAEATAYYTLYKNDELVTVTGSVFGNIVKPRGSNGYCFDSIFQLSNRCTLAEMESDEKNKVSYRRKALEKLSELI